MKFIEKQLDGADFEIRSIGKIAAINRGTSITIKDVTLGEIPVIAGGRTPAYFHNVSNRTGQTIVIAGSGAYAGFVSWWEKPIFVSDAFTVEPNAELLPKYCFYWLKGMQQQLYELQHGGGVPHVYPRDVSKLDIPIPCPDNPQKSLKIQSKIVGILDRFTELIAALTFEHSARKMQFNYYRNQFLRFEGLEVEWKTLGEIGDVKMCKRILKHETQSEGEVPFYKIGTFGKRANAFISNEVYETYSRKYPFPKKGDILISASGTIGRLVVYNGEPAYFQDSNIVWLNHDETIVTNKYLRYCYQIVKWFVVEGGVIDRLYIDNIKKTIIPVPYPNDIKKSLVEQTRIVTILDKFEDLTNTPNIGLPSEIALRQKQYEYYLDQFFCYPKPKR